MSETEVEKTVITIPKKEYDKIREQLAKKDRGELLDISRDVVLEAREKLIIYGIRLGMDFAAMNKKAWAAGIAGCLWGMSMMFFWLGLAIAGG